MSNSPDCSGTAERRFCTATPSGVQAGCSRLAALADEIELALQEEKAEQISRLVQERDRVMCEMHSRNDGSEQSGGTVLTPALLAKLSAENEQWIQKARRIIATTRSGIDHIRTVRTVVMRLSDGYGRNSAPDRHISVEG